MPEVKVDSTENTDEMQTDKPWLFKPGQSGNPAGKPKGTKHFSTLLMKVLKEQIELKGVGKVSLDEAMSMAIARKAVRGDVRAFEAITDRVDGRPAQSMEVQVTTPPTPIYGGKSTKKI